MWQEDVSKLLSSDDSETAMLSGIEELLEPTVDCFEGNSDLCAENDASGKIFCDPVHGQMLLPAACVAIIDTPQFQRLRHIKQTGFTEFVFPGACHNRFGHSLGVCYLAGKFLQELKEHQPELLLTDTDILCVQLAGLCHDLGHGPYSHTWEQFVKIMSKMRDCPLEWKHEIVSANMLDFLIEENDLYPILNEFGIGPKEIEKVKDYIIGAKPKNKDKAFLHQIVNNDDSGLDVDKWDYFLRDCLYLGLPCSFEYERLMQFAKVFKVGDRTQICFRDKVVESVYNVFRTRSNLHRRAYQHRMVGLIERMFLDALVVADEKLMGPNGEVLLFWEWSIAAAYDSGEKLTKALKKFSMLTDSLVFSCLKHTSNPDALKASKLILAIDRRSCKKSEFYQHIGFKVLKEFHSEEEIHQAICSRLQGANILLLKQVKRPPSPVLPCDICVHVVSVHWGKGAQNPVEFVHFYSKSNNPLRVPVDQLQVSAMLPSTFEEIQLHVICRRSDLFALIVTRFCFLMFCQAYDSQSKNIPVPEDAVDLSSINK